MSDQVLISIIGGVLALLGSGGVAYWVSRPKAKAEARATESDSFRNDFEAITDIFKADNDRLRQEYEAFRVSHEEQISLLRGRISELEKEVREERQRHREEIAILRKQLSEEQGKTMDMVAKLSLFETSHHDLPLPQWLKSVDGIMLSVNDAYVEAFLEPCGIKRDDYIGKNDYAVWPREVADMFKRDDAIVRAKRRAITFREDLIIGGVDVSDEWVIMKYPRFNGRTLIGIAGICFPISYYTNHSKKPDPPKDGPGNRD